MVINEWYIIRGPGEAVGVGGAATASRTGFAREHLAEGGTFAVECGLLDEGVVAFLVIDAARMVAALGPDTLAPLVFDCECECQCECESESEPEWEREPV